MIRISGGRFKGRALTLPPRLRPTEAKVRQALFNILGEAVVGARVVDGFAGSGAIGLEALSRGAAFVAFVEADTEAVLSIRDNLSRLSGELSPNTWQLVHLDVERGLRYLARTPPPFDLVILDPPYRLQEEAKKALNTVGECAMLARTGLVAIEHHQRTILPVSAASLQQWRQHRYGATVLSFYRLAG